MVLAAEVVALEAAAPHGFAVGTTLGDLVGDALAAAMLGAWIVSFVLVNMPAAAFGADAKDGGAPHGQDMGKREPALVVGLGAALPSFEGCRLADWAYKRTHSEFVEVATLEDDAVVPESWCDGHCSWTTAENHFAAEGCVGGGGKVHHWIWVERQTARGA